MKCAGACTAITVLAAGWTASGEQPRTPLFREGDRWAVIGDSITHGRRYHSFIYLFYVTRHPDRPFRLYNCGISGDTAAGAVQRYDWDIAPNKPTVATVMMGMNDVGRDLYGANKTGAEIEARRRKRIEQHVQAMTKLFELLTRDGCRIVYITPSIYDETGRQKAQNCFGVNEALGECGRRVAALAPRFGARVVQLHDPMTALNAQVQQKDPNDTLVGPDRVHPGDPGQFVMAYLFLKSVGAQGTVARVDIDAAPGGNVRAENCSLAIVAKSLAKVAFDYTANALPYPVLPAAKPALAVVPFTDELNREILRITGLDAGDYAVEIDGEVVAVCSRDALAAGLNLAVNARSPMLRQAQVVMALNEKRHAVGVRLRNLAAQRHWICSRRKDVSPDDFEAMKAAILADLATKKETSNYGYFKAQAENYIQTKPHEKELLAERDRLTDEMWKAAVPRSHRIVVRKAVDADRAALRTVVVDECNAFDGWTFTSWTNTRPDIHTASGRLVVRAPRTPGVRDMLGLSRRLAVDLPDGAALKIRMRASAGSPFGVEAVIDGALTRLLSYKPASGEWQTLTFRLKGKRLGSLTLILAEGSAGAAWDSDYATYEFDRIWVELQKP